MRRPAVNAQEAPNRERDKNSPADEERGASFDHQVCGPPLSSIRNTSAREGMKFSCVTAEHVSHAREMREART